MEMDDDVLKMQNLSMINANARFELLNANQQLLDFQMNRLIRNEQRRKQKQSKLDSDVDLPTSVKREN